MINDKLKNKILLFNKKKNMSHLNIFCLFEHTTLSITYSYKKKTIHGTSKFLETAPIEK